MENKKIETKIVNIKNEPFDVYIGRGSLFGNPFRIGKDGTREEVIRKYKKWLVDRPYLLKLLPTLEGQRCGCWCRPSRCHGTILLHLIKDLYGGKLEDEFTLVQRKELKRS